MNIVDVPHLKLTAFCACIKKYLVSVLYMLSTSPPPFFKSVCVYLLN